MLTEGVSLYQWGVLASASLVAAIIDLRTRRIPNAVTVPLLAAGVINAVCTGGVAGFADALAGCALLALPYVLLFVLSHGGAGDAKLMGAVGAWLGVRCGAIVFVCVALAGITLALMRTAAKRRMGATLLGVLAMVYTFLVAVCSGRRGYRLMQGNNANGRIAEDAVVTVPYGVAIFVGVCLGGVVLGVW